MGLGRPDGQMSRALRGRELHVAACPLCGLISRGPRQDLHPECARCGKALYLRKPDSVARTWALLIAAAIVYVPANMLPIMRTETLFDTRDDTILGGVLALWRGGSWDLAIIVFLASVVIPLAKIGTLATLAASVQFRWPMDRRQRTRLYRLIEWIGQWSMLDIFVLVLLVALVQFSSLARVAPGAGAIAFGAVVVLTMLAAQAFDPRLIWDSREEPHGDA